ncbi:MAG: tetratricopeptide repeat protein [Xanthomonadales bacterium]|nr:tetratricopeptide repeat protein [Xanthomonadales bacterium]
MLNEAIKKHREGDQEGAAAIYRQILENEPDRDDVHHLMAVLCHEKKDLDQALEHAEKAIDLNGDEAHYHQTLAGILHARGDLAGARSNLERAVEIDPNLAEARNTLGYLLFRLGEPDAAEQQLRLALKIEPESARAMTNLGSVYIAQRRLDDARGILSRALELDPESTAARATLGQAMLLDGAAAFAEECFRRCVEARPESLELKTKLAEAVLANQRPEEAEVMFDEILGEQPGRYDAVVGRADAAAAQGRHGEAVQIYSQALMQRRGDPPTLEKLGDALLAIGDHAAAEQCFRVLVERGHAAPGLRNRWAQAQDGMGQTNDALDTLKETLAEDRNDLEAGLLLAQLHARAGEHEEAIVVLDGLPEKLRQRNRPCLVRARAALALGEPERAIAALEPIARESDYRLEALELRGRALDMQRQYEEAASIFAELATAAEMSPPPVAAPIVDWSVAASWPQDAPEDGRPEPVFLVGLPGSGIDAVHRALGKLAGVEVLGDRLGSDGRRDMLARLSRTRSDWSEPDEDAVRMDRRRYWHAVRRARSSEVEGLTLIDRLPVAQAEPAAIARYFPRATLLVVGRHPADHLLHAESFGWRDGEAATPIDLDEFYAHLMAAEQHLALELIWLDFDRLRGGEPLPKQLGKLNIDAEALADALTGELRSADGLAHYWPPGHWKHYADGLGLDGEQLPELVKRLAGEQEA